MGLIKVITENVETKKSKAKEEHKQIDKKSTKTNDILKRLEVIEKMLGLED